VGGFKLTADTALTLWPVLTLVPCHVSWAAEDMESWMRQIPFNVLTFEAITKGALDVSGPGRASTLVVEITGFCIQLTCMTSGMTLVPVLMLGGAGGIVSPAHLS
jgi:hypothetical protein